MKKLKRAKVGALVFLACLLLVNPFLISGHVLGAGQPGDSAANPIIITTAHDLDNIRNGLDKHYRLGTDIDLAGWGNWEAIGNYDEAFTGSLDGNHHTIRNLTMSGDDESQQGFIGYAVGATFQNIRFENANISFPDGYFIGILAGEAYEAIFTNVYAQGFVSGYEFVGGIVGYDVESHLNNVRVDIEVEAYELAGGMIGYGDYLTSIRNSYAVGTVSAHISAGGLMGGAYEGSIEASFSAVDVHVSDRMAGGILGQGSQGSIERSYTTGNISGDRIVGGLVGSASALTIDETYVIGEIQGGFNTNPLIGFGSANISASYWDTETTKRSTATHGGTGRTTHEMKQKSFYSGWDFEDNWIILYEDSYPMLQQLVILEEVMVAQQPIELMVGWTQNVPIWGKYADQQKVNIGPDSNVHFTSMNNSVASVQANGLVEAHSLGITTIQINAFGTVFQIEAHVLEHIEEMQGNGTSNNPYIIRSAEHLNQMRDNLTAHYRLGNDIDMNDLDLGEEGWLPIGMEIDGDYYSVDYFKGTLNGAGYTISNLKINRPSLNDIGLFANILEAEISNINLQNVDISGGYDVGAITGWSSDSSLYQIKVDGSIIGEGYSVGGLIGNSYATTFVQVFANVHVEGHQNVGGIVGSKSGGEISLSHASGAVIGEEHVGGLLGFTSGAKGVIANSLSTASVTGEQRVGGLIGMLQFWPDIEIVDSYVAGPISAVQHVGGLVGFGADYEDEYSGLKALRSYWDINVTGQSSSLDDEGEGLYSSEMMTATTYADWDKQEWGIYDEVYPFLRWLNPLIHFEVNVDQLIMETGDIFELQAISHYSNGAQFVATDQAVYSSSDENVVTIDSDGIITAVGSGQATITVNYEKTNQEINVQIYDLILSIGEQKVVAADQFIWLRDTKTTIQLPTDLPLGTTLRITEVDGELLSNLENLQLAGEVWDFHFVYPAGEENYSGTFVVTMGISDDVNVDNIDAYYFLAGEQTWEPQNGDINLELGIVVFTARHFSIYGIFRDINVPDPGEGDPGDGSGESPGEGSPGDGSGESPGEGNPGNGSGGSPGEVDLVDGSGEDRGSRSDTEADTSTDQKKLPNTATSTFTYLILGIVFLSLGVVALFFRHKKPLYMN